MNNEEKKYNRSHIGEAWATKETLGAYKCEIIDGGTTKGHCTVRIGNVVKEVPYVRVCSGAIKYEYHPSVAGVGFLGEGCNTMGTKGSPTKAYKVWHGMLSRCYSNRSHIKHPSYKDVAVCEEWLNYQNFAKWFEKESNYQEGWHLDKDLLSDGAKVYSPETCIFIPQALNSFMTNKQSDNTSGYVGVSWRRDRKRWLASISDYKNHCQICIGSFTTKEEAAEAYKNQREVHAKEWQNAMKGLLPTEVLARVV